MDRSTKRERPLFWIGASRKDYGLFPSRIQEEFGFELFLAQTGQHPPSAKFLKGIAPGVLELVESFDGNTFRAVYTIRFENAVYVLHSFMKKSKTGIKTPRSDIELVERRLREAEKHYSAISKKEPNHE